MSSRELSQCLDGNVSAPAALIFYSLIFGCRRQAMASTETSYLQKSYLHFARQKYYQKGGLCIEHPQQFFLYFFYFFFLKKEGFAQLLSCDPDKFDKRNHLTTQWSSV